MCNLSSTKDARTTGEVVAIIFKHFNPDTAEADLTKLTTMVDHYFKPRPSGSGYLYITPNASYVQMSNGDMYPFVRTEPSKLLPKGTLIFRLKPKQVSQGATVHWEKDN